MEQPIPGLEPTPEEMLPPALEKAIAKYHAADAAAKQSSVDHKKDVDSTFATVKTQMHEHGVSEVKLRIDGTWKLFKLRIEEKGKFKKVQQPKDQKSRATKRANGTETIADKTNKAK